MFESSLTSDSRISLVFAFVLLRIMPARNPVIMPKAAFSPNSTIKKEARVSTSPLCQYSTGTPQAKLMSTIQDGKINFPNMLGTKRRRMRSGGNVSTASNNAPKKSSLDDEKLAETSQCKGANTIPIFLKSTSHKTDEQRGYVSVY